MSEATSAHSTRRDRTAVRAILGMLVVVGAGVGLAWAGAEGVRDRTVQVKTIQAGTGPLIQPQDGVLVDYEGRLENGTVFDSSAGKGPIPMLASQVIPGFAEALTRMQQGGRYKIHIPARLAYGANPPAGAPIPPNADLDFDVNIIKVVPNAAAMVQQQQQQIQPQSSEPQR